MEVLDDADDLAFSEVGPERLSEQRIQAKERHRLLVDEVAQSHFGFHVPGEVPSVDELEAQDIDDVRIGVHDDHRLPHIPDSPGIGVGQRPRRLAHEGNPRMSGFWRRRRLKTSLTSPKVLPSLSRAWRAGSVS